MPTALILLSASSFNELLDPFAIKKVIRKSHDIFSILHCVSSLFSFSFSFSFSRSSPSSTDVFGEFIKPIACPSPFNFLIDSLLSVEPKIFLILISFNLYTNKPLASDNLLVFGGDFSDDLILLIDSLLSLDALASDDLAVDEDVLCVVGGDLSGDFVGLTGCDFVDVLDFVDAVVEADGVLGGDLVIDLSDAAET